MKRFISPYEVVPGVRFHGRILSQETLGQLFRRGIGAEEIAEAFQEIEDVLEVFLIPDAEYQVGFVHRKQLIVRLVPHLQPSSPLRPEQGHQQVSDR